MQMALGGFFAAVLGATILRISVPRSGAGAIPPTGTTTGVSVWPGTLRARKQSGGLFSRKVAERSGAAL
jgi:hypothetical protein